MEYLLLLTHQSDITHKHNTATGLTSWREQNERDLWASNH